jgi:hypothetical protein
VQAEVKSFEWLDLERDPDSATAEGSTLLTIVAGPAGEPGAETFQVTVCTSDSLAALVARDGVVDGRHFLFVESLNTSKVEAFILDRFRRLSGSTWADLAEKIARLGHWEFEDFVDRSGG